MALNREGDNTANNNGGSNPQQPQTQMAAALGAAGLKSREQPQPGAAPSHPTHNVGEGRNPGMNPQSNAGQSFSFRAMGVRSMMSRNPASEVLSKLTRTLTDIYKEAAQPDFEHTLIPVDLNQAPQLDVSVLVLCVRDKQNPNLGVAFYTFVLEGSVDAPPPKFEQIMGKNVEIVRTVAEAFNKNMLAVVTDYVARVFPDVHLFNAEACVVPRDFNLTDTQQVYALAANAAFACSQELESRAPNFSDINLANAQGDSNLVVRTQFNQNDSIDAVGHPQRTPVLIEFTAAPQNQNNNQLQGNNLGRTTRVATVGGYVDLVWDAPAGPNTFGGFGQPAQQQGWGGNQPNFQRYAARYVMTMLENMQLLTLPAQLLSIIPALSLREGNQWVHAFKPNPLVEGVDMHDIGAIGIEVNFEGNPNGVGVRIPTKSPSFTDESLFKLVAATFKPGMILSLDVPECGPSTWYNSAFAAAAEGNPDANNAILEAANYLTNNCFGQFWKGGRVAVDENNLIHLGYYMDPVDGTRKDLRHVDYLAVLNLIGEKDAVVVKDWSDTFLKSQYPLALRLSERKRIITGFFSSAVFTGYARRVTFTPEFLDALANGARQAGLTMRAATSLTDLQQFERASGQYLNDYLMGSDPTGVFNRGGNVGSFGNTGSFRSSFSTRW